MRVAYLSTGQLYLRQPGAAERQLESPFAVESQTRAQQRQLNRAWRQSGDETNPFSPSAMLWGGQTGDNGSGPPMRFIAAAPTRDPAKLLYLLDMGAVFGLFQYDLGSDQEKRLFHTNRWRGYDLATHPSDGRLACAVLHEGGSTNIGLLDENGGNLRELTGGDSQDEAPAWVPGQEQIVFHSRGIGRDPQGNFAALGTAAVELLDIASGDIKTLVAADDVDYLLPRFDDQARLYCLRRPHDGGRRYSFGSYLLDIVLLPYRLVRTVFAVVNLISVFTTKKPLSSAGGPQSEKTQAPQVDHMIVRGRLLDLRKANKQAPGKADGEAQALAPKDWILLRLAPDGSREELASHVLAFDVTPDGQVVYSDGRNVYHLDPTGKRKRLFSTGLVEALTILPPGGDLPAPAATQAGPTYQDA